MLVLAIDRSPVFLGLEMVRSSVILPIEKRSSTILLTGQVAYESEGIVRLILIGRRHDIGPDYHHGEYRKSYHDGCKTQNHSIPQSLSFLVCPERAPETKCQKGNHEE